MLVTSVETYGMGGAMDRLRGYKKRMSPARLGNAAYAGAAMAESLIKAEMLSPKSGIQWPNLPNISSKSGEMPAVQSGELINKMNAERMASSPSVGVAKLEAKGKHAWWMELGFTTKDGGFHIRPFMRPGIQKHRSKIIAAMKFEMMKG